MENILPEHWNILTKEYFGAYEVIPLRFDTLPNSFVYCRRFGAIVCPFAHHTHIMGALSYLDSTQLQLTGEL